MIDFCNVYKSYNRKKFVIKNFSYHINEGDILALIGHNGAGKTTTLKILTGIIKPTKGDIYIYGKSITKDSIEAKRKLSYVPDKPIVLLEFTVLEYLNFIGDIYNVKDSSFKEKILTLSEKLNMNKYLHETMNNCSHGIRKKSMIMGAFLSQCKVLVLDEPLTGLDPESVYILKELLSDYSKQGNIVIFSTHILQVAEVLCNKFCFINNGEIVVSGTLSEIKKVYGTEKSIEDIFMEVIKGE